MTVVDLGAAPGSWSQIAGKLVGDKGLVIASDILEMDALPDVTFLQGDFREEEVFEKLLNILNGPHCRRCNFRYGPQYIR